MRFYRNSIFILIFLILFSCNKGSGDYRMEDNEFSVLANQELLYQDSLDKELFKITVNQVFIQFVAKRQQLRIDYLNELKSVAETEDWIHNRTLSDEAMRTLELVRLSPVNERDKLLLKYIVLADQNLIGLHVKASGPVGLKNVKLRSWADTKLLLLIEMLNNSQSKWHGM